MATWNEQIGPVWMPGGSSTGVVWTALCEPMSAVSLVSSSLTPPCGNR
jgi:hypothetical protein